MSQLGIVIPTLNAARTLAATLDSVDSIVAAGGTVMIVDGGSTDGTQEVARLRNFQVVSHKGPLYSALNAGFRQLDTAWLTWINGDDLLYADVIGHRIANAGNAAVLYGRVDFIDMSGRFAHSWMSAAPQSLLHLYRAGFSPLLQQGTLFRRDVFDSVDGFDERYEFVADADFWWRALEAGYSFMRHPYPPVAAFRLHANQISQIHSAEMRAEHGRMVQDHGGHRTTLRSLWAAFRWRLSNLPSYAMRILRWPQLDGRVALPASYTIPNGQA